ncbi:MAG: hypothetical protein JXB88_26785 [Spirochaetales bacterium]|nr:hypothetical protein [Spirochaetales bacterium]
MGNVSKKINDWYVEKGEIIEINRYGKPIAHLIPVKKKEKILWGESALFTINNVSLTKAILDERDEE